ncbi:hypothetical protein NOVA_33090 [Nocardia nova]|uniref:hypothetical protein n=1 Tax=Nocardia nova TaxID=37330 RepID=UPI001C463281|nr:hypothetical protein [Nocardia nova]MBV7707630.1 hypothetical protein [Nocardia nova]
MIIKRDGQPTFICDICDDEEATFITPDHHICVECDALYPLGSDEFFEALDWSERTLG